MVRRGITQPIAIRREAMEESSMSGTIKCGREEGGVGHEEAATNSVYQM